MYKKCITASIIWLFLFIISLKMVHCWAIICCCWPIKFIKIAFWFRFSSRSAAKLSLPNSSFCLTKFIVSEFDLLQRFCLAAFSSSELRFLVCLIVPIAFWWISKTWFHSLAPFFFAFFIFCFLFLQSVFWNVYNFL